MPCQSPPDNCPTPHKGLHNHAQQYFMVCPLSTILLAALRCFCRTFSPPLKNAFIIWFFSTSRTGVCIPLSDVAVVKGRYMTFLGRSQCPDGWGVQAELSKVVGTIRGQGIRRRYYLRWIGAGTMERLGLPGLYPASVHCSDFQPGIDIVTAFAGHPSAREPDIP